ncbi:hypothetical protein J4E05_19090 [Thalassospira sp. NFXS8]|uniref:hypothetical protein n=1 Tax=Thalassospira sp. NFXS8 TaxID=2819093 RepID=UPI0032DFD404
MEAVDQMCAAGVDGQRFFRAMTSVLHRFGDENRFEGQVLQAGLNYVLSSDAGKMMRA